MTATAAEFRRQHRAYGVRVPAEEISALLACGWRFADPDEMYAPYRWAVLTPPAQMSDVGCQRSESAAPAPHAPSDIRHPTSVISRGA